MTTDTQLGELLVRESLMTEAQLNTALEFQKSLGGDLRNIVVKLGYVKDKVLAGLVAQEENVGTSADITEDMVDIEALKTIPREVLEKHQVIPLNSEGNSLVLAMADPNDLRAIEEIQFLANRSVEPAVTTKHAIRKTLNQLDELIKRGPRPRAAAPAAARAGGISPDRLKALRDLPIDKLIRAYLVLQVERGELSVEDLLSRASKF